MSAQSRRSAIPLDDWRTTVSGHATLELSSVPTAAASRLLRLDFDFRGGKGFVVARRAWPRPMPSEYALHLKVRSCGARNDVEIKMLDPSGQNVWRHVAKAGRLSARWHRWTIRSRDIEFAWGPASGSALASSASSRSRSSPARAAAGRCRSATSSWRI